MSSRFLEETKAWEMILTVLNRPPHLTDSCHAGRWGQHVEPPHHYMASYVANEEAFNFATSRHIVTGYLNRCL